MRLGIVGAGRIASSHINAASQAGFIVSGICARENSSRALELASRYEGLKYFPSLDLFLSQDFDAFAILVTPENILDVLQQVLSKKKPVLVEKPLFSSHEDLVKLSPRERELIRVGFNRRFYSSVQSLKRAISGKIGTISATVPELSQNPLFSLIDIEKAVLQNSVHILDLLKYLFGNFSIDCSKVVRQERNVSMLCLLSFASGFQGTLQFLFGVPENTSIRCWVAGSSIDLLPIEKFQEAKDLSVVSTSQWNESKIYEKNLQPWVASREDLMYKPGFVQQYNHFYRFASKSDGGVDLANVEDAEQAFRTGLEMMERLLKGLSECL